MIMKVVVTVYKYSENHCHHIVSASMIVGDTYVWRKDYEKMDTTCVVIAPPCSL
jgi:predicted PolB exonuclease-like 3'-5' exonuclease